MFDSLPDGVVAVVDASRNIATVNRAIADLLGQPTEDLIGRSAGDVFGEVIPPLVEIISATLETGEGVRNYTIEARPAPGGDEHSSRAFLVSTAVIEEVEPPDRGIVLVLHDITELSRLRRVAAQIDRYGELIGTSSKMRELFTLIETVSAYDTSVLIVGETGTGKELVARSIHDHSNRRRGPFVPVNCSALPDELIESELFGHVKGAFTGASTGRRGRFEAANAGTLFLDEIGTLSMGAQVKLLRALQTRVIEPVGSSEGRPVDVRIVSASNRDLAELAAKQEFREDLLYRLKVIRIVLPPLRDRRGDIPVLAAHFIDRLNQLHRTSVVGISQGARDMLMTYEWPGNVRELENAIEHAFVLAGGPLLEEGHFPPEIRHANSDGAPFGPPTAGPDEEEESIRAALLAAKGNRARAAEMLGMHRGTLWRKAREFRIEKGFGKAASGRS